MNKGWVFGGVIMTFLSATVGTGLYKISKAVKNSKPEISQTGVNQPSSINVEKHEDKETEFVVLINKTAIINWLAKSKLELPINRNVYVCSGYGCLYSEKVKLKDSLFDEIKLIMDTSSDPESERNNIAKAINAMKAYTGKITGTDADVPGEPFLGNGNPDQMSTFDETTNTVQYLYWLGELGYIKYHNIEGPTTGDYYLGSVNRIVEHQNNNIYTVTYNKEGKSIILPYRN